MRVHPSLALIGSLQFGNSGPFDCNVYALQGPEGLVLVDSGGGTDSEALLDNLQFDLGENNVVAVIVTHCHLDHSGGAASIQAKTGCRVITSEYTRPILEKGDEEASGLRAGREAGVYPPDFRFSPCQVDLSVRDGEDFEAAGLRFKGIHVRGHSEDSFCYVTTVNGQRWFFGGDVLFYGGILGVINFEGSEMGGYRADLPKLEGLQVEGLFPGHGLFTLRGAQRHIDIAREQVRRGFIPRQIGQGDLIF